MAGTGGTPYIPRPATPNTGGTPYIPPSGPVVVGHHLQPVTRNVPRAAPGTSATPWTPPPIPAGYYNPLRDIEAAEGKKGSQQTESGYERERTNAENTYATNLALLEQREGNEKRAQGETLGRLKESFQRLGAQQADQGNATGTLYGGALIAAAQKRAANEGRERATDEAKFAETAQADANERGKLSVGLEQLLGPGGSLTEAMRNARANENTFEGGINTLKASEAAERGYKAPIGPPHPLVAKAKAPIIVGHHPQPVTKGKR